MTVKPVLWTQPAEDGTHDIKLYIHHQGKKKYRSLDIKILPADWDAKNRRVRRSHPLATPMNAQITRAVLEVQEHLLGGGTVAGLDQPAAGSFLAFLKTYIREAEEGKVKISKGTLKNYHSLLTQLTKWLATQGRQDLRFDEVDLDFYFSYRDFLIDECDSSLTGGVSNHVKNIKKLMSLSRARRLHNCAGHEDPEFRRHRSDGKNKKIYLNEQEIERLIALDLSQSPGLERERDRFVISYFFLLRYEDSTRIRPDKFFVADGQRYYRNDAGKTDEGSVIPVKPLVWDMLQRHGFDFRGDNPTSNHQIKTIAALAGIDTVVTEGGKTGPKWRFVTTHTARRSAATNLSLQNVSTKLIADLGGWSDVKQLEAYLRASATESARAVRDLPFFR